MTNEFAATHRQLHDELGVFGDFPNGQPCSVGRDRVALACRLDEAELDTKRRSLAAHASQTEGLAALMGEATYRSWYREETFRRPTATELGAAATWERALGRGGPEQLELVA